MFDNDSILGFHSERLRDYNIIEEIGEGGSSHVYSAYSEKLKNQKMVIKVSKSLSGDDGSREADILISLKHPNIPTIYEYYVENGRSILVMEYIDGDSVQKKIDAGYLFGKEEVYKYGLQLCQVVDYLHSRHIPIIHGDIKPDNVIIMPSGNICLIDFNISSISFNGKAYTNGYTQGYGAPEQKQGFMALKAMQGKNESEPAPEKQQTGTGTPSFFSEDDGEKTVGLFSDDETQEHNTYGLFEKTAQIFGNNTVIEQEDEKTELLDELDETEQLSDPDDEEIVSSYIKKASAVPSVVPRSKKNKNTENNKNDSVYSNINNTEFLSGALTAENSLKTKSESIVFTGSNDFLPTYGVEIDKRTDVYSIGATLFRMYTNKRIDRYQAEGNEKVAGKGVHEGLLFIIDKAVQEDPEKRYQSAGEMLKKLQKIKPGKKYERVAGIVMPASGLIASFLGIFLVIAMVAAVFIFDIPGKLFSGSDPDSDRTISDTPTPVLPPDNPTGTETPEENPLIQENFYREAIVKMSTGEYRAAIGLLEELRKDRRYSDNGLLAEKIIECYLAEFDNTRNIDTLTEAQQEFDNNRSVIAGARADELNKEILKRINSVGVKALVEQYLKEGSTEEARECVEGAKDENGAETLTSAEKEELLKAIDDKETEIRARLDEALAEGEDSPKAKEKYLQIIEEYPGHAAAYRGLLTYYISRKSDKGLEEAYELYAGNETRFGDEDRIYVKNGYVGKFDEYIAAGDEANLKKAEELYGKMQVLFSAAENTELQANAEKITDAYTAGETVEGYTAAYSFIDGNTGIPDREAALASLKDKLGNSVRNLIGSGQTDAARTLLEAFADKDLFTQEEYAALGSEIPTASTVSATPKPTPKPTVTPKPTPKPTATPKPTPKPTATPEPTATPVPVPKFNKQNADLGDKVTFGKYEWYVFKIDGNVLSLVSTTVVSRQPLSTDSRFLWKSVTKPGDYPGTLRAWLNSDFLKDAFSSSEQKKIIGAEGTTEKVSTVMLGDYSKMKEINAQNAGNQNYWLLDTDNSTAYYVYDNGRKKDTKDPSGSCGVRPVIRVKKDK